MRTHELIAEARKQSRLSLENFAALTSIEPTRLQEFETSSSMPTTQELNDVARVFGAELLAFMQGRYGPSMLFFRSMRDDIGLDDILLGDDGLILGDFLRCVGRIKQLRDLLSEPLPTPSWMTDIAPAPIDNSTAPFEQGAKLAKQAREYFNLGEAPVPSMNSFLLEHGVEVFLLTPGRLQTHIDGASTLQPAPAVLINPIYEGSPWRQRATMAHELCHLLYDRNRSGGLFMISPTSTERRGIKGRQKWSLFDEYLSIEQRANAFAAHFLAPAQSVNAKISQAGCPPDSAQAATLISSIFGVGYETAVNILFYTYNLTHLTRERLLRLPRDNISTFNYREQPADIGLFSGQLREFALRALACEKLSKVSTRRMLEISMDAPLPQGRSVNLTEAQRAPIITQPQRTLKYAARILMELDDTRHLYPSSDVVQTEEGWTILVMEEARQGEHVEVGKIFLSHDNQLLRHELS